MQEFSVAMDVLTSIRLMTRLNSEFKLYALQLFVSPLFSVISLVTFSLYCRPITNLLHVTSLQYNRCASCISQECKIVQLSEYVN